MNNSLKLRVLNSLHLAILCKYIHQHLLNELCVLDGLEEERALFVEEKLKKHKAIGDLGMATLLGEMSRRPKLRALW
jgi:hypothetical protein